MHRNEQTKKLREQLKSQSLDLANAQRLTRQAELCSNPYVSVRMQILRLRGSNAPARQVQQLIQNAAVLEQNPFNLKAWKEFKQLGGL